MYEFKSEFKNKELEKRACFEQSVFKPDYVMEIDSVSNLDFCVKNINEKTKGNEFESDFTVFEYKKCISGKDKIWGKKYKRELIIEHG